MSNVLVLTRVDWSWRFMWSYVFIFLLMAEILKSYHLFIGMSKLVDRVLTKYLYSTVTVTSEHYPDFKKDLVKRYSCASGEENMRCTCYSMSVSLVMLWLHHIFIPEIRKTHAMTYSALKTLMTREMDFCCSDPLNVITITLPSCKELGNFQIPLPVSILWLLSTVNVVFPLPLAVSHSLSFYAWRAAFYALTSAY